MINLKITKYRDFTKEEIEAREEYKMKTNRYNTGFNDYETLTPNGENQYQLSVLSVEITDEQWESIRKAVLEKF